VLAGLFDAADRKDGLVHRRPDLAIQLAVLVLLRLVDEPEHHE